MRVPTIDDVARLARVSKASVSKALDPRPDRCDLSAGTRARIIDAAARLEYRPRWRARALARRRGGSVGMLYADHAPPAGGVYERFAHTVATALATRGYRLLFVPMVGGSDECHRHLREQRIDGCIVVDPATAALMRIVAAAGMPAVLVNQRADGPLAQVLADDAQGAGLLVDHLVALGHHRIAYWETPRNGAHVSENLRRQAFAAAIAGRAEAVMRASPAAEFARELALRTAPTAVVAYNHADAFELLRELASVGARVPTDISLACFDEVPISALVDPPMTSVDVPMAAMGAAAADLVVDLIEARSEPGHRTVLVPERLIVRASTAAPVRNRFRNRPTRR